MNFKVSAEKLNSVLKATSELLKEKKSNPILGYYLFTLTEDSLVVKTASDDGTSLSLSVNAEKDPTEEYSFAVPSSVKDIIALIKGEMTINFEQSNNMMNIAYESGNIDLGCMESKGYPEQEFKKDAETYTAFEISAKTFHEGISFASHFISDNQIRPVMCGVHFVTDGNGNIDFVGTDAISMAVFSAQNDGYPAFECNIPSKSISSLLHCLKDKEKLNAEFNGNAAKFSNQSFTFITPTISGAFPRYKAVMPSESSIRDFAVVKKGEILHAATMVNTCSSSAKIIKLVANGETITLKSEDIDRNSKASSFVSCQPTNFFEVGLRADKLIDGLNAINSESVKISYIDENRPILLTPVGDEKHSIILMPISR